MPQLPEAISALLTEGPADHDARELIQQALTHPTWANEHKAVGADNQRLEFLGDAVLELIVTEALFSALRDADEGLLSRARAQAVNEGALANAARAIDLGTSLRLGRGEEASGGRTRDATLADAFEAVIAAIYLTRGMHAAAALVHRALGTAIDAAIDSAAAPLGEDEIDARAKDPKSVLQELTQRRGGAPPIYELQLLEGPAHNRIFRIDVIVAGETIGHGAGRARREAERLAAAEALGVLRARGETPST